TQSAAAWASNQEQAIRAQAAAAKTAATEKAKEEAKSAALSQMRNALVTGQRATYENMDGMAKEDIDRLYSTLLTEMEKANPAVAAGLLVHDASMDARTSPEVS